MDGERAAATVVTIKQAIKDRACLSGTHVEFRVRFAPHALGRDKSGQHSVIAFEYGGMTLGQPPWVVLHGEPPVPAPADQRSMAQQPFAGRPQFDLI